MLAVSALRSSKDESQGEMESFSASDDDFADLSDRNLLGSINFDDFFVDIKDGGVLLDLEMDSEIFADFSASGGGEESEMTSLVSLEKQVGNNLTTKKEDDDKTSSINSGSGPGPGPDMGPGPRSSQDDQEIVSKRDESLVVNPSPKEVEKGRKSSSAKSKNNSQGKIRKVKVDWNPDLHRRFVQAVEQLGVDKAVPSRILEIMGIDCLTRHNIASHLQKYRSHRKHLLAREAEAANWRQRRQMYGVAVAGGGGHGGKRDISPWLAVAPTIGFPPMTPIHHLRALHVWGHPSVDQPFMHMYPPSPAPPAWAPPVAPPPHSPPALDSYWHAHRQRGQNAPTPGTPCFSQPLTATKFASPLFPGIPPPPHAMYNFDPGIGVPPGQSGHQPLFDSFPSKETIDAAVGDVLSKPWLPLPLGLRSPALESVMAELQRQGISKIPPSSP